MSDSFEYSKSNEPVGESTTPYQSKQWNSIPDINSNSYSNNSLTLVTFDLSSIYNSSRFTSVSEMYITIPLVRTTAFSDGTALVAPGANLVPGALNILKPYSNLIHQADIQISNNSLEQTVPYLNKLVEYQLLSQMSATDIANIGPSLGYSSVLDNPNSLQFNAINAVTASYSGNGFVNNRSLPNSTTLPGGQFQSRMGAGYQNLGTTNVALSERMARCVDTTKTAKNTAGQNLYGTTQADFLMSPTQLSAEIKSNIQILNTNYIVQYDMAVIRMKDLYDSIGSFPLCKRVDMVLRLYLSCGAISVTVNTPNTTTTGYFSQLSQSTFTNSVPFVVGHLADTSVNGGIPANVTNIVTSLCVARPASTTLSGVNLALSGASHPSPSCRVYYPSIQLKPSFAEEYILRNRNKRVVYRTAMSSIYTNIVSGGSFSSLVQNGVRNITGVVIMPFLDSSATAYGSGNFGIGGSPFDTNLSHPISLINVNAMIGGVNVLQNPIQYGYDEYLQQVSLFESISNSDLSVSCGVITQQFWDANRVYFIDCSRGLLSDQMVSRNVDVSFSNNTNVPISVVIYVLYNKEIIVDVETGAIQAV